MKHRHQNVSYRGALLTTSEVASRLTDRAKARENRARTVKRTRESRERTAEEDSTAHEYTYKYTILEHRDTSCDRGKNKNNSKKKKKKKKKRRRRLPPPGEEASRSRFCVAPYALAPTSGATQQSLSRSDSLTSLNLSLWTWPLVLFLRDTDTQRGAATGGEVQGNHGKWEGKTATLVATIKAISWRPWNDFLPSGDGGE